MVCTTAAHARMGMYLDLENRASFSTGRIEKKEGFAHMATLVQHSKHNVGLTSTAALPIRSRKLREVAGSPAAIMAVALPVCPVVNATGAGTSPIQSSPACFNHRNLGHTIAVAGAAPFVATHPPSRAAAPPLV